MFDEIDVFPRIVVQFKMQFCKFTGHDVPRASPSHYLYDDLTGVICPPVEKRHTLASRVVLLMPRVFVPLHKFYGKTPPNLFLPHCSRNIWNCKYYEPSFTAGIRSHFPRVPTIRHQHSSTNIWPYIYSPKTDEMAPQLDSYFKQVDALSESFIDRLRKAVAIPSVSADEDRREDVVKVGSPVDIDLANAMLVLGLCCLDRRP